MVFIVLLYTTIILFFNALFNYVHLFFYISLKFCADFIYLRFPKRLVCVVQFYFNFINLFCIPSVLFSVNPLIDKCIQNEQTQEQAST